MQDAAPTMLTSPSAPLPSASLLESQDVPAWPDTGGVSCDEPHSAPCWLSFLLLCPARAAVAKPLALVGATIINGTGAAAIPDGVIIVDGNKIVAAGRRADVKIPSDAQTIDVTGKFITPGIIDTNVHLVLMIVPEFYAKYEGPLSPTHLNSSVDDRGVPALVFVCHLHNHASGARDAAV